MFERLARTYGCVFVPDVLSSVFLNPLRKADAIHPNDEGYALIARRIARELAPRLAGK